MKIVIVGGGTAGWWTAGCLEYNFPDWDITLIESKDIPIIGVGESTVPQIGTFLSNIGIKDDDWLHSTNALKKFGNRKFGWRKGEIKSHDWTFWWNYNKRFEGWAKKYRKGEVDLDSLNDFYDPKDWAGYAYHVCAFEMGKIVKDSCKNVKHVYATITEKPEADFVFDCSGTHRQFVENRTIQKYEHTIIDRAYVGPHKLVDLPPVTQSIAKKYGWQFIIGLKNRIGSGYAYSSKFISDEDALTEFKGMIKECGFTPMTEKYLHFKWEPCVLTNPWSGNVIAIGNSAGFVDPLEANALFHIQHGIETFVKCFKRGFSAKTYNKAVRIAWNNTVDFITHHYALSDRDDTEFWRYWQNVDCSKTVWDNYLKRTNLKTNLYPDAIWATMASYFDEWEHAPF
jgi:tryptophan halogenase